MKSIIALFFFVMFCHSCTRDESIKLNKPKGSANAIAVYNQAYQENYLADDINFIVDSAINGYVLLDPFLKDIPNYISKIKARGNQVGGYISIGTGENWRDDFDLLKPFLVKKMWEDWDGEYFVDETKTGIIDIMKSRIDQLALWGCDWVEFDNMDWIFDDDLRSKYAFSATIDEGILYYQELCAYVHQKGMKCMAKNTTDGAEKYDGVLYESFNNEKNWWNNNGTKSFLNQGKLVIVNHYNEVNCNQIYRDYIELYNDDLSFICEDRNLKRYVHYNN